MQEIKPFNKIMEDEYNELMDELKGHRFLAAFESTADSYQSIFNNRTDDYTHLNRFFAMWFGKYPRIRLRYDKSSGLETEHPEIYNQVVDNYKELFGDDADLQDI
jgi:hypothetical protein